MIRGVVALAACFSTVFLFGTQAMGKTIMSVDLKADSRGADVVCAGREMSVTPGARDDAGRQQVVVSFRVDRVLKGDLSQGDAIEVSYVRGEQQLTGYDIVLLRRQGQAYAFLRPRCSVRTSDVARSPYAQSPDIETNLRWEVLNAVQDPRFDVRLEAFWQVSSVLSAEDIAQEIEPLTKDPDLRARALAFAACVEAGNDRMIPHALEFAAQEFNDPKGGTLDSSLILALETCRIKPEYIALLLRVVESKNDSVRRVGSYMLRHSGYRAALPTLKRLLDDSDERVRYNAVLGLSEITKDFSHAPSIDKFRATQAKHLKYWKTKVLE